jgi:Uma2 family endonuclease
MIETLPGVSAMTVAPILNRVTPDDFLRMPDRGVLELVDGKIVEKKMSAESSRVEGLVFFAIQSFLRSHPVATAYPSSLGYRCFADDPDKIRRPDVSLIGQDRLAALADPNPGLMPIIPDLAVEVVSPHDTVYEVDEKVREYLNAGVPLVWIVDPEARVVTVHPYGERPQILTAEDEITIPEVLPNFRCRVAEFFPAR